MSKKDLVFKTGSNKSVLTFDGNVGINTTDADESLHVNSDIIVGPNGTSGAKITESSIESLNGSHPLLFKVKDDTGLTIRQTGIEINELKATGFVDSTGTEIGVPKGAVVMWSGWLVDIPDGYYLCNGQNGTPDLVGKFLVGAGGLYNLGSTGGGSHSHNHSHTVSKANTDKTLNLNNVSHTHEARINFDAEGVASSGGLQRGYSSKEYTSTSTGHDHSVSVGHNHNDTTTDTDTSNTIDNNPKYYRLAFIKKR